MFSIVIDTWCFESNCKDNYSKCCVQTGNYTAFSGDASGAYMDDENRYQTADSVGQ